VSGDLTCTFRQTELPHRPHCGKPARWLVTFAPNHDAHPDNTLRTDGAFIAFACDGCIGGIDRRVLAVAYLTANLRASLVAGGPRCWAPDCTSPVEAWGDHCPACIAASGDPPRAQRRVTP
jgi:hypothetical protein